MWSGRCADHSAIARLRNRKDLSIAKRCDRPANRSAITAVNEGNVVGGK